MPRLLHTSDWHLGAQLSGLPRDEDQRRFLEWLALQLTERQVDVLVVAGDVFDQSLPSAEAQRLYYRFLHRVAGTCVRQVVVVGGNHDSAARLEAPRDLLGAFQVQVVGGIAHVEDAADRCLIPILGADGQVACVIAAVPYVHEYRLGVRPVFSPEVDLAAAFRDGFTSLYRRLGDEADRRYPGIPLVATGHLACVGGARDDAPAEIHLIGSIGGLPPSIFDDRMQYVALGHLHAGFRVGSSRAWYCGTPVALTTKEARTERRVLLVDTAELGGHASVESVPVPTFRQLLQLRAPLPQVCAALSAVKWPPEQLAPYVEVVVEVEAHHLGLEQQVVEAAPKGVQLIDVRQVFVGNVLPEDSLPPPSLATLTEEEVFLRLCQTRHEVPDAALLQAFRALLCDLAQGPARGER